MAKWRIQRSALARRFILTTITFSSILTMILICVQLALQYQREINELELSQSVITHSLIKSLSESTWNYDNRLINLQLRGITNLPYISAATLTLADGSSFTAGQSEPHREAVDYPINHTRNPSNTPLGNLHVEINTDALYSKLQRNGLVIVIGSVIRAAIIVLFMLLIMHRFFGRYLAQIVSYLQDPNRPEKLVLTQKNNQKDELDLLVSAFNTMSQQIRDSHQHQLKEAEKRELLQNQLAQMDRQISLGEMATSLAHELNQPLSTITGYADISQRIVGNELPAELKQSSKLPGLLDKISAEAVRASEIIRRIREFVKGRITHKEQFNLVEMLQHSVSLIAHRAQQQGVCITQHYPNPTQPWQGDKIQLQQVIINLLKNALDALAEHPQPEGQLCLELTQHHHTIEITLTDNGPGIPEQLIDQIFAPFVSTKKDGMGVGLSISHNIVESHGGSLSACNQAQGGACFTINLPLERS